MHQPDRRTFLALLTLAASEFPVRADSLDERKKRIKAMESQASPEALQRRARSEAVLKGEGVPINQHLPVIDSEKEAKRRSKDEVAQRALCLLLVAVKGAGLDQPVVTRISAAYGLSGLLSPKERLFIANETPSQTDRLQFSWRYEAAWVLLWALSYVDSLNKPTAICNVQHAVDTMRQRLPSRLFRRANCDRWPKSWTKRTESIGTTGRWWTLASTERRHPPDCSQG